MKYFNSLIIILISIVLTLDAYSSVEQDEIVRDNLRLLAYGRVDEVKAKIPDLLAKYPNDPGIKLLHGAILDDGKVALEIYKLIIDKYEDSEWADDAYWRTVQYYAVAGQLDKANETLENFRRRYPASPYVAPASDVVQTVTKMLNKKSGSLDVSNFTTVTNEKVEKPLEYVDLNKNKVTQDFAKPPKDIEFVPVPIQEETTKPIDSKILEDNPNKETNIITEVDDFKGYYGLQVGIYRDKGSAEIEKEKFLKQRLRTSIEEKSVENETMFAVVIGHYSSLQSAEAAKIIVKRQCGCEPVIYKK